MHIIDGTRILSRKNVIVSFRIVEHMLAIFYGTSDKLYNSCNAGYIDWILYGLNDR